MQTIELNTIAADQRELIAAFRAGGEKSFQHAASPQRARENYEQSCAANGLAKDSLRTVFDAQVTAADGEAFSVRVYDPREETQIKSPVLLFFHGGGWVIGSLDTHDAVCRRLANLTSLPVVAVDYRLAPEHPFPTAHYDCRDAIAWVLAQQDTYGWDPQQIITVGDSAGGGLATACAFLPGLQVPGTRVIAQLPLYPMLDQSDSAQAWQRVSSGVPLTKATLEWFLDNYLPETADRTNYLVSPLLAVREAAAGNAPAAFMQQVPALILTLGHDPLAQEGIEYAKLLALGGTRVELVHLPAHAHGIFTSAGKVASGEKFLTQAADFIRRVLQT